MRQGARSRTSRRSAGGTRPGDTKQRKRRETLMMTKARTSARTAGMTSDERLVRSGTSFEPLALVYKS